MPRVEIPESIMQRLAEKAQKPHYNSRTWTPQEDEILIKFWPLTLNSALTKHDVAKEIGCTVATCRKRYEEIKRNDEDT